MNKIDDITFDDVMEKANKAGWKRVVHISEQKDRASSKVATYYSEIGDFYVVIGHSCEKGIFGYHGVYELIITKRYWLHNDRLITFTGSNHFFREEKRRIEKTLNCLEKYLDKYYGEWDRQKELEELKEKEEEQRKIHNALIKTFK